MKPVRLSFFVFWFGTILFFFAAASVASLFSGPLTSVSIKPLSKNIDMNDFFIRLFQSENHYFSHRSDLGWESFANVSIRLLANIQPTDIRTFLGRELPGFSIFDTEIIIAGEGTDFTTLPVESAPPMEVLLKERELAEKQLAHEKSEETPQAVGGEPSVFIYHTHSWESFKPLLDRERKTSEAVSSNEKLNVIAVGKMLSEELGKHGIAVRHDKTDITEKLQEKNWTYSRSYAVSREIIQEAMAANRNLTYLIDIHRDAQPKKVTTAVIDGKNYARIYFIVGKEHKNYENNLRLATKLHQKLEEKYPGLSRGVFAKPKSAGNGIYNQDLSQQAMLIEFGGVDNNMEELQNTVEAFAEIFSEFYFEAEMVNG